MQANTGDFAQVNALPSFRLFTWFFVIPGLLLVLLSGFGLWEARHERVGAGGRTRRPRRRPPQAGQLRLLQRRRRRHLAALRPRLRQRRAAPRGPRRRAAGPIAEQTGSPGASSPGERGGAGLRRSSLHWTALAG